MYVSGRWRGASPDLPGWTVTTSDLDELVHVASRELQDREGETIDLRVVHVPSLR
jgi:hypothetical protein